MGGGLLQLVAYGAQDAYISGNPQITFWKSLYKRHTNFAMESFRVNFSGTTQWGSKQTAIVGRHADLLYSTYLQVELPKFTADGVTPYLWNNDQNFLGYNLLRYIELDIGGQIIDKLYGEWLFLWTTLTQPFDKLINLVSLVSGNCDATGGAYLLNGTGCGTSGRQLKPNVFYIPLDFFYTKSPGAALPLIALQYHEVKINVIWNEPEFIAGNFTNTDRFVDRVDTDRNQDLGRGLGTGAIVYAPRISRLPTPINAAIYIDYIYLDTEERRRMAQASHEYLIEQVQFNEDKSITSANNRIDLTFNHPVKELLWVVQPSYYRDCSLMAQTQETVSYTPNSKFRLTPTTVTFTAVGFIQPVYNISFTSTPSAGYTVELFTPGSGLNTGGTSLITISGTSLGGATPANDLTFRVSNSDGSGITNVVGTPASASATYLTNCRLRPFDYSSSPVYEQWLQINGQDRMDRRYGDYFNKVQRYQHHSGGYFSGGALGFDGAGSRGAGGGVFSYSFALKPEEHQPSGTCNFSRIDTATIVMNMADQVQAQTPNTPGFNDSPDFNTWDVRVYAINYNILRVMSGMAGLAYSN